MIVVMSANVTGISNLANFVYIGVESKLTINLDKSATQVKKRN